MVLIILPLCNVRCIAPLLEAFKCCWDLLLLFSHLTKLGTSYLGGGIGGKYITYIFTMLRREKDFF
jgi:hypothetical protein